MKRSWLCAGMVWFGFVMTAGVDGATWEKVWQDDFNRETLGDNWVLRGGGHCSAKIVDGQLHLDGGGATLLVNRPFAPDVKLTFTAMADPDDPPCDLSAGMACSPFLGYGHLLAFGGTNNQANQILGLSAHKRHFEPDMLIEHGRTYKMEAIKEGPRLAYYADGKLLVEAMAHDVLGGPGFDHVALVTWNGMIVDDVVVYERSEPHPEGPYVVRSLPTGGLEWSDRALSYLGRDAVEPKVAEALKLYNSRKYREAFERLADAELSMTSVVAMAYVLGDLGYESRSGDKQLLVKRAFELAEKQPNDRGVADFARAAEWFSRITITRRDRIACMRLYSLGEENNPFYPMVKLYLARSQRASGQEGGDRGKIAEAMAMFKELKSQWPEVQALREMTGERIPWGKELIHPESAGPAWARYLQETLARQQAILTWWVTVRQYPDGQLGGGWGDDVEILRTWVPACCVTTACEPARTGIARLAQGVWNKVLDKGYTGEIGDVEHASEPSADSLPTMMLLRYGDPKWVEYNLRSAKTIRAAMDVNDRGFLHFISNEFGTEGVRHHPRAGGDTGYHARAMKHFLWLAWYGIEDARDVFLAWCDGWHDVTMRQIGNKPPGYVPASVWFPSGSIAPPDGSPWYDEQMNYWGFPGLSTMILDSFMSAYALSADPKYLDPIRTVMQMATLGPLHSEFDASKPRDNLKNLLADIPHWATPKLAATYRLLTGDRVYDEYAIRRGNATQRYRSTHDLEQYARSFEGSAKGMRNNWTQFTSEVLQTDRAGLAGAKHVMGAYTGSVSGTRDTDTPTFAVTWDTPDLNFAALVTEATPSRVRAMLYSFNEETTRMGLCPWRLQPGVYVVQAGERLTDTKDKMTRYSWGEPREVTHLHRATPIWIDVPAGKEWVVDVRLRKPIARPAKLPDLAIGVDDMVISGQSCTVTVHNIGSDASAGFDVVLESSPDGRTWKVVDRQRVDGLPQITNLDPVRQDIALKKPTNASRWRIRLDPDDVIDELYELNNSLVLEN